MSQARAVPVALAASGSPRAGLRFASVISRRSDACSRARMTPILVRTRLFQFTRPGNATRLARDCPAKKSQPLRGNFGRTTRRFATRIWNPGNVVSTASFPHHSTPLAAIRFGARKEGGSTYAERYRFVSPVRKTGRPHSADQFSLTLCRQAARGAADRARSPFASQPSHSALTAKSQNIGFALSRLAHVAQASQFWISPGSRAQAASVPATMLGNARAPRTCASGPSQKRPDLASPPSQSDTSPSGYAPGRQSAPLHPLRSPPCRFDLPARSQRVGARAIARLQHRKPGGGRLPRSCNLRADCRRWKSSARLPRRNDTAHSVTADQRPDPADPR